MENSIERVSNRALAIGLENIDRISYEEFVKQVFYSYEYADFDANDELLSKIKEIQMFKDIERVEIFKIPSHETLSEKHVGRILADVNGETLFLAFK